jgi:hypothetical protein
VIHPTGPSASAGDANIGFLNYAVTAGVIYRLEVLLGQPPLTNPPTPQAHHYKLSFSGVSVDVGINSPAFRYFEHNQPYEVFQVNMNQGESFSLDVIIENPNQGANQARSVTLEILERGTLATILGPTVLTLPSLPPPPSSASVTISIPTPFPNGPGQLVLKVTSDGHYKLDKKSGTDHGIYYDTCPPPPAPPPAGEPRTIGYWKNHPEDTESRLPRRLGMYQVNNLNTALSVFNAAQARNAHDMLAAQLLASKLNVASNVPSTCVASAISQADSILSSAGYTGPGSTTPPTGSNKQTVNTVKDALDNFNNNGCP